MTKIIYGNHDEGTLAQLDMCLNEHAAYGVLCADGHKGYSQPVGAAIAYRDHISVSGVGYDIACGNMAVKTEMKLSLEGDYRSWMGSIMDEVVSKISFGVGRVNAERVEHPLFDMSAWKKPILEPLKDKARAQLGTIGSGNHYVDIFRDEEGFVWVGVHFGSRGLGHTIATQFLKLAGGKDGMDVPPTLLPVNSDLGDQYLAAMFLAGEYAYAGREWVARKVANEILGVKITDEVHNHHNFAWNEEHFGQNLWVVRKGATPAFPGQRGFVGGSMGDQAVIIEGVDTTSAEDALYTTVHGAGRVMSRTEAKGKIKKVDGKVTRLPGRITQEEMDKWLNSCDVVLRGGDLDEAPQAYRRLSDVLCEHLPTIKILHVLKPLGVAMAGGNIVDPYKD